MRKFIYLLIISLLFITACSDDDGPSIYFADEKNTSYELFADELELSISFIAEGDWYLSSISSVKNPDGGETQLFSWLGVNRVSGRAGNIELKATTTTNYTGEDRTVYITLVCGKNSLDFSITQKAKTKNGEIPEIKTRTYPKLVNTISEEEGGNEISKMIFKYNTANKITDITKTYSQTKGDSLTLHTEKISFAYPLAEYITYHYQTIYTDSLANITIHEGAFALNSEGYINNGIQNDNYSWKIQYNNNYFSNVIVNNSSTQEVYQNHIIWSLYNATEIRQEDYRSLITYTDLENDERINVDFSWIVGNSKTSERIILEKNNFPDIVMFGMEFYGKRSKNYRNQVQDIDSTTGETLSLYTYEYTTDEEDYITEIVVSEEGKNKRTYKITYIDAK